METLDTYGMIFRKQFCQSTAKIIYRSKARFLCIEEAQPCTVPLTTTGQIVHCGHHLEAITDM